MASHAPAQHNAVASRSLDLLARDSCPTTVASVQTHKDYDTQRREQTVGVGEAAQNATRWPATLERRRSGSHLQGRA